VRSIAYPLCCPTSNLEAAIEDLSAAISLDRKSAQVYASRGVVYRMLARYDQAMRSERLLALLLYAWFPPKERCIAGLDTNLEDDLDQLEVKGLRLAYERAGAGPPLFLLHGGFGISSSMWSRQLDGLSDEFTVVA